MADRRARRPSARGTGGRTPKGGKQRSEHTPGSASRAIASEPASRSGPAGPRDERVAALGASRGRSPGELPDVLVVTGLSGAGKSTALRTLGDLGFYCVDNLPPPLVADTVRVCDSGGVLPLALGLDVRVGTFLERALDAIESLRAGPWRVEILYVDAADDVLVRRFKETRRPHPLLGAQATGEERSPGQQTMSVVDGVGLERERLGAIRNRSSCVVDTSHMSVHELRREVTERYGPDRSTGAAMITRLVSFGFKYGIPLDADLLFDVRFLDNPHFVPELRERVGTTAAVRDFVLRSPGCGELLDHLERLLAFCLPRYEREGKSYLTVAIGCTGGRHRSVAVATALGERLAAQRRFRVGVVHRDLAREGMTITVARAPVSWPGLPTDPTAES